MTLSYILSLTLQVFSGHAQKYLTSAQVKAAAVYLDENGK
jgi:hypothetical protein